MGGRVITNTNPDAGMGSVEQRYLWVEESSLPVSNHSHKAQYSKVGEQGQAASSL